MANTLSYMLCKHCGVVQDPELNENEDGNYCHECSNCGSLSLTPWYLDYSPEKKRRPRKQSKINSIEED
jgi:uncharacterized Zn finger protein